MKKLLPTAIALTALAFSACQNEEIASIAQGNQGAGQAIGFSALSSNTKGSRTTIITPDNLTTTDFDVYAFNSESGALFMGDNTTDWMHDGVQITYKKEKGEWDYTTPDSLAYWPSDGSKLNFYAISPSTILEDMKVYFGWQIHGPKDLDTKGNKIHYTLADEYTTTKGTNYDVMYATAFNYDKSVNNTKVKLTFKHILSQVVFKAKTAKSSLKAEIQSIKFNNIPFNGTFTIPSELAEGSDYYTRDPKATDWSVAEFKNNNFKLTAKLTANSVKVESSTESIWLSDETKPMMMIPQVINQWATKPGTPVTKADGDKNKEVYLEIAMKLTQNGQYIIGSKDAYTTVYVPFSNNGTDGWQPGKRYIYTLIFGGGYDDQGKPILSPITFEPETSDWVDAAGTDVSF